VTVTGEDMHRLAIVAVPATLRSIGNGDPSFDANGNPL
jgi:hypothetical protein